MKSSRTLLFCCDGASRGAYTLPHLTTTQLVIIAIIVILAIIPSVIILRRLGFSPWWAIIAPLSPLNIIGLWVLAFVKWPVEDPFKS